MSESRTRSVAIAIYDGVEILDFAGPYEVFNSAPTPEGRGFSVVTVAVEDAPVTCSGGLRVLPHYTIANHPPLDIVVVPGGNTSRERADGRLPAWLRAQNPGVEVLASVCTGAFLLGDAGVLSGKRATTHWGAIERLRKAFPDVDVVADERVVDTGRVVTSAGVSAGIDMALYLVERLLGRESAERTARYMEYDWRRTAVANR